ncbi:hypothetical protein DICPUDRAFT_80433 [Dictyostelium purpureum]|uniref:Uncharacterized protein n=1 Tax=Dictyostelium purpureum TaxID=5786 RepID=F0ZQG7_DICPU|nr:uncharacterized protein DICPUDRAFT_80433 [Dictyostelium purpureum]EGC33790.1 hypothetical protein DICPUDRAFT_80433 [Dictyostelium purpureum]|eukprot:XP_003289661.1 hypothetical protein DICPUDRAFT_80433 [Dictyostelium purpureum]
MKYHYNFILLLFIISFNSIFLCNSLAIIEDPNNNKNNNTHLFILSIPDCYVEGVVLELGKCFNFETYGCNPSSIVIKANKNNLLKNDNSTNLISTNKNEFYGIIFYNINCSGNENEVIEFECKKSKKIKLMGNVKLQCLTSDNDLEPVKLESKYNEYFSSSSIEKVKIYEELKPLIISDKDDELLLSYNNFSNGLFNNINFILKLTFVIIIIITLL